MTPDAETTTATTVVIVDDHEVVALGLTALLENADGIEVIGPDTTHLDRGLGRP